MTKILSVIIVLLAIGCALAAEPSVKPAAGAKQIAIIHYDQLKARKLDGSTTNITFSPMDFGPGLTPCLLLRNDLLTPREITLQILGLKEPSYDVYIDQQSAGAKTKAELEAGIQVSFSGTLISADLRDYYKRLQTSCTERAKRYARATDSDGSKASSILKANASWVDSIERGDNLMRSTTIMIVPSGQALSLPGGGHYPVTKPKDFEKSAIYLGQAVHVIRGDVLKTIKNPLCQRDVLDAMTPMDFVVIASKAFAPGSKVEVNAQITNWTDRQISGSIKLNVPAGWKVQNLSADISTSGYGKSAVAKFVVTVPGKVGSDTSVKAAADLLIEKLPLTVERAVEVKATTP